MFFNLKGEGMKSFTLTVTEDDKGSMKVRFKNNGYQPMETIGVLQYQQQEILNLINY